MLALMVTKGICPCRAAVLFHHASCFTTKYTSADLLHIALSNITVVVEIVGNLNNVIQSAVNNARKCVSETKSVVI